VALWKNREILEGFYEGREMLCLGKMKMKELEEEEIGKNEDWMEACSFLSSHTKQQQRERCRRCSEKGFGFLWSWVLVFSENNGGSFLPFQTASPPPSLQIYYTQ